MGRREPAAVRLGIGLSHGDAAAALPRLGRTARVHAGGRHGELAQRLQQFADAGETVLSGPTMEGLSSPLDAEALPPQLVKGRDAPVTAFKLGVQS